MKTRLTEMFGIELPIFAFSHCRDVVVAMSKAGGMGVLGLAGHSPEQVERELSWIDAHIDGKPYGVDVLMPQTHQKVACLKADLQIPEAPLAFMRALADGAGVPVLPQGEAERLIQEQVAEINMTPDEALALLESCLCHPIKLVVNALGTPPRELVNDLHRYRCSPLVVLVGGGEWALRWQSEPRVCGATPSGWAPPRVNLALTCASASMPRARKTRCRAALSPASHAELKSRFTEAYEQPGTPKPLPMPLQSIAITGTRLRFERAHAKEWLTYLVGQIVGVMKGDSTQRQVMQEMFAELADSVERLEQLVTN